ncbi:MAG: hypothetical protein J6Y99_00150 [Bacteroidales bacterium]|nr:hypothetical protein [Bacteroidales bacterium]
MTIGIDLGISATKIVALREKKVIEQVLWEGPIVVDRVTEYVKKFNPSRGKIKKITVTGVGSRTLPSTLCGVKTTRVEEFEANAMAAKTLNLSVPYIIASMGTGTSLVKVDGNQWEHIGGCALGGGTLIRLFQLLLPGGNWALLRSLAEKGNLDSADQCIKDFSPIGLPELPMDTTTVNLGKVSQATTPENITVGLLNMVVQNIGVMARLSGLGYGIKDYVVIGRVMTLPKVNIILERLEKLYGIRFHIPTSPEFMTALGAAMV